MIRIYPPLRLEADRWTAFVCTIDFIGRPGKATPNFTGATLEAHIRLLPDTPGVPLVDLDTVISAASEGVRLISAVNDTVANHIIADRLLEAPSGYELSDLIWISTIGIRVNESTMEGLPPGGETGDDVDLHWDIHITPSGGLKQRWLWGPFIVRAGVTQ